MPAPATDRSEETATGSDGDEAIALARRLASILRRLPPAPVIETKPADGHGRTDQGGEGEP